MCLNQQWWCKKAKTQKVGPKAGFYTNIYVGNDLCHDSMNACVLSHVQLFVTPWSIDSQTPLPIEFSRPENSSGLPFAISSSRGSSWPRDRTHPLILHLLHWQVISLPLHHVGTPMALDNDCIRSCIPIGKFSKYNIRVISDSCIHLYLFLSQASSFQLMATQLPKPRSHHWLFSSF